MFYLGRSILPNFLCKALIAFDSSATSSMSYSFKKNERKASITPETIISIAEPYCIHSFVFDFIMLSFTFPNAKIEIKEMEYKTINFSVTMKEK